MSNDKLYARQICFLFLAFALPVKLITMPALAAKHAAEDLWISAAINFAPDLAMILRYVCSRESSRGRLFLK